MFRKALLISLITLTIFSCKKEGDDPKAAINLPERSVMILNEGNFRSANASVSVYYPHSGEVFHDQYSAANQGIPLGDVAQSMSSINGSYWLVVNNSGSIEIIDKASLNAVARVSGLNSPRYCIAGPDQKVYVSDLYEDVIYVVDASTYAIRHQIPTFGWTEEMEIVGDRLFVCQVDSSQLLVINTRNDSIEQRIPTERSPLSLVLDVDDKLWVGCSGGIDQSEPALMRIDPITLAVEQDLKVTDITKSISELALSPDGSELYFLMDDVYKMKVNASQLPTKPWYTNASENYYAMGVDPNNGEVYLSDAIDYQQDGAIYRLDANANQISRFKAGLIPGFFYFEEP